MKHYLTIMFCILCSFAQAEWNIDTPSKNVPQNLQGEIFGRNLKNYEATWGKVALTISSEEKLGGWPESEVTIFIGNDEDKSEWYVTPEDSSFDRPHVHMKFGKKGADFPGTLMFMEEYSLYLKVVERTDSKAVLQIHLSLPDYKKTYLYGTFEAKINND